MRRLAARVTNASILVALLVPYVDEAVAGPCWYLATSALIAWISSLLAIKLLAKRRKPPGYLEKANPEGCESSGGRSERRPPLRGFRFHPAVQLFSGLVPMVFASLSTTGYCLPALLADTRLTRMQLEHYVVLERGEELLRPDDLGPPVAGAFG